MSPPSLQWLENGHTRDALWAVDKGARLPTRVQTTASAPTAAEAYRLACAGTALLWRGDYPSALQLLHALGQHLETVTVRQQRTALADAAAAFAQHRQTQAQRTRVLGQLLIEVDGQYRISLPRAPQVQAACAEVWGPADGQPRVLPLRHLLGLIGAHEWRKKGVPIAALGGAHIHPHHGVFSPVRGEYVDLVAQAPLPAALHGCPLALDMGVGTGVLSAVLARRGVPRVIGTDVSDLALACAHDNLARLGLLAHSELQRTAHYPAGLFALVVCNPPWLPAQAHSALDQAIYDEDSAMLRGFLSGLSGHLCDGGEGWLILSDLAEHLGLRPRTQLLQWIADAGLQVLGRLDTRPRHRKVQDTRDPLHAARSAEITSLWRLARA